MSLRILSGIGLWLLLLLGTTGFAQTCIDSVEETTPDSRFEVSDNEVTDLQTGLIWQRCSVGQSWDGSSCIGLATTHNWQEALTLAAGSWRLPNLNELTSIVERACLGPTINLTIFPRTINDGEYWSSSPYASTRFTAMWGVFFGIGHVSVESHNDKIYVRLVRDGDL